MKQTNIVLRRPRKVGTQFFCIVTAGLVIFPIFYAVMVSFMGTGDIFSKEIIIFPKKFVTDNYKTLFRRIDLITYLINSLIVATVSSACRVFFCAMAAYALAFFQFRRKNTVFLVILATALVPQEVVFVQNYLTISRLHLLNTYTGICSVYLVNAMTVFVLRQNFLSFPDHVRDAALLDGCSSPGFFFRILLPTSIPILLATFLSSFVSLWNIYLWPMVVTNKESMRTMQVAITIIKGRDNPEFGPVMAAATISLLPAVVLFIVSQYINRNRHYQSVM